MHLFSSCPVHGWQGHTTGKGGGGGGEPTGSWTGSRPYAIFSLALLHRAGSQQPRGRRSNASPKRARGQAPGLHGITVALSVLHLPWGCPPGSRMVGMALSGAGPALSHGRHIRGALQGGEKVWSCH